MISLLPLDADVGPHSLEPLNQRRVAVVEGGVPPVGVLRTSNRQTQHFGIYGRGWGSKNLVAHTGNVIPVAERDLGNTKTETNIKLPTQSKASHQNVQTVKRHFVFATTV